MKCMEGRIRKSGKLAVNMREDGNCEDNEAGTNGKQGGAAEPEEGLLTLSRKQTQCHG
jgi:hypothetical protein